MLPAYNPRAVFDIFRAEFAPIDYGQDHHMKPVEEVHDMKPHRHSGIMLSKTYSSMISGGVAGIGMSSLIAAITSASRLYQCTCHLLLCFHDSHEHFSFASC
jgi:hypothetical protein